MLITDTQVDELLLKLADLSGLDQELADRCGILIRSERYDEAVSRAFVVLEERLRELLDMRGGTGVHLAQKAFTPETGQLVHGLRLPPAEIEGIRDLFIGAFKAFRNRAAHTMAGYGLDEARAIIHLVNLLLLVLEQVRLVPAQPVPEHVARALSAAATERLQLFLERIQDIGIGQGQGKNWIPYRAMMMYRTPSQEKPMPNQATVFYLSLFAGKPVLMFNTGALGRVVGLDRIQLEADLLQTGCIRTAAKDTPIRLFLSDNNDQATFDRIYQILAGLMEKHRV